MEAVALIERLGDAYGPLVFRESAGSGDGTQVMCVRDDELPPDSDDVHVGDAGGFPFYVAADLYRRQGRPRITLDVAPGPGSSFSLEGLEGVHFVTRSEIAS